MNDFLANPGVYKDPHIIRNHFHIEELECVTRNVYTQIIVIIKCVEESNAMLANAFIIGIFFWDFWIMETISCCLSKVD